MANTDWLPLESNPRVINRYLRRLGVPKKWGVSDVLSISEEDTAMIPTPCLAILLLFPLTPDYIEFVLEREGPENQTPELNDMYFMRQTVNEACGTIALIHAIANNEPRLRLKSNSVLKRFLDTTKNLSPKERGQKLGLDKKIANLHRETAHAGETDTDSDSDSGSDSYSDSESGSDDDDGHVDKHFIALVKFGDKLVELDGNKPDPVLHGNTTDETFVRDAFRVCRSFMAQDPASYQFTVLSFGQVSSTGHQGAVQNTVPTTGAQ